MTSLLALAVLAAVAKLPLLIPQAQAAEVVGTTSAKFGVTPLGAASYAVPIAVPPGTMELKPEIVLQYNSQDENGLMGVGWRITGLSYITRCAPDLYIDDPARGGIGIDPVDYDQHDKFCLNGERLVAVNGSYGADGTEYRTIFEEFSKVVSYGSLEGGPTHFRVWKRTGEILDYGATDNAKIKGQSREAVRSWALSRLSDAKGNYIAYSYNNDRVSGDFAIGRIDYTGNAAQGLAPYSAIEFVYETRPDVILVYHQGDQLRYSKRVSSIRVLTDGQLAREYRLAYEQGSSNRSRLIRITECADATTCFKPTTFTWSANPRTFTSTRRKSTGRDETSPPKYYMADFNGDGRTDFVRRAPRSTSTMTAHLSQGDGRFLSPSGSTPTLPGSHEVYAVGDFNGDGLPDVYSAKTDSSGRAAGDGNPDFLYYANGNGTFAQFSVPPGVPARYKVIAYGDFDGDGLTDLYMARMSDSRNYTHLPAGQSLNQPDQIWLANRDGSFRKRISTVADSVPDYNLPMVGDFNGDGRADLVFRNCQTSRPMRAWLSNGDGSFEQKAEFDAGTLHADCVITPANFNDDGLSDFFLLDGSDRYWSWLSKGDGTFVKGNSSSNKYGSVFVSGDFNGDRLTDLLLTIARDGRVGCLQDNEDYCTITPTQYVLTSTGDGNFLSKAFGNTTLLTRGEAVELVGDFNGDGLTDYLADPYILDNDDNGNSSSAFWQRYALSNGPHSDTVTKITNGHGLGTDIAYKHASDTTVYSRGSGAAYPVQEQTPDQLVVASVNVDNGIGGKNEQTHSYSGSRTHTLGVGNLGFAGMILRDVVTGMRTETVYSQDWTRHHQGLLLQSRTIAANNVVLKDKSLSWGVRYFANAEPGTLARCFRFNTQTVTVNTDLNGAFMSRVTDTSVFDDFGFPTEEREITANADGSRQFGKTVRTSYQHNTANWRLGLATSATVTLTAPGKPDDVRTTSFTYDGDGFLTSETADPGTPLFLTKTYTRNGFGLPTAITETWGGTASDGIDATSRTTAYQFDAKMRFPTRETNPLGHAETTSYHPVLGIPVSKTGPNALTTAFAYDAFGRLGTTTHADGTTTIVSRPFCGGSVACATGAIYKLHSITSGGEETEADLNVLNEELRTGAKIDGRFSYVDKKYDAMAREIEESAPYFSGDTRHVTLNEYDVLGRKTKVSRPDGSVQTAVFNGLVEVDTNELGQARTIQKDELNRQTVVTDAQGQSILYGYDAAGRLASMISDGKVTSYAYDLYGNKVSDVDPDKGSWTYRHNALGNAVEQTNARGEVTRMTYDVLERMLSRIDNAAQAGAAERTSIWVYDTAANGISKLHRAASGLAASGGTSGYRLTNSYDGLSRIISSVEAVDGESFTSATTYDQYSRPSVLTYPSNLAITNLYDAQGKLADVRNTATGISLWTRLSIDARGNIARFKLGNGVESFHSFDAPTGRLTGIYANSGLRVIQDLSYAKDFLGNLTRRQDKRQNLVEDFLYDSLNRVVHIDTARAGGAPSAVTLTYSVNGNILTKSDVGSYAYGQVHGGCSSGFAGPHAVTQITGVKNTTYCYDANGNMVSGDGRTVQYTAFDMPTRLAKGGNSVSFFYGPDRERYKRIDETVADGVSTTVYVADRSYERLTKPGEVSEKVYIGDFAVMTRTVPASGAGSVQTDYLHRDHLGSVDVITDPSGAVAQQMSFDAFGKRREANWQPYDEPGIINFDTSITTRGFTGHEQVDPVGLVHMNGRIYEPEIGRFLSADPLVEDIDNLQTYNRYSYVRNNPLTHTDPSGFQAADGDGANNGLGMGMSRGGSGSDSTSDSDSPANTDPAANNDLSARTQQANGEQNKAPAQSLAQGAAGIAQADQTSALNANHEATKATQKDSDTAGLGVKNQQNENTEVTVYGEIKNQATADPIAQKLQLHTDRAVKRIDSLGNKAFSQAQLDAIRDKPYLRDVFRGYNIDKAVRAMVAADKTLNGKIRGTINRNVDFTDSLTGKRYDMTTLKSFPAHQRKYGKDITHIDTTRMSQRPSVSSAMGTKAPLSGSTPRSAAAPGLSGPSPSNPGWGIGFSGGGPRGLARKY